MTEFSQCKKIAFPYYCLVAYTRRDLPLPREKKKKNYMQGRLDSARVEFLP